jgi:heme oxygenase
MSSPTSAHSLSAHSGHGHAPAGAGAAGGATLPDQLKEATWDLHEKAERHPFQRGMMMGKLPREAYVRHLEQMALAHEVVEARLREAKGRSPAIAGLLREWHFRLGLAKADLKSLGGDMDAAAIDATKRFAAHVSATAAATPAGLLGYLYVLEGSTNGGRFIAPALARAMGMTDLSALSYQVPHGDQQQVRWGEFRAGLGSVALTPAETAAVHAAAETTFRFAVELSDALAARFGMPPEVVVAGGAAAAPHG